MRFCELMPYCQQKEIEDKDESIMHALYVLRYVKRHHSS